jgi:hypothetical protein
MGPPCSFQPTGPQKFFYGFSGFGILNLELLICRGSSNVTFTRPAQPFLAQGIGVYLHFAGNDQVLKEFFTATSNRSSASQSNKFRYEVLFYSSFFDFFYVGRVEPGGYPPGAPTDPDVPNYGIRFLWKKFRLAI